MTIVDPGNTWIDVRAEIGQDTVIYPFTYIHGRVKIGKHCSVGPFAYLREGTVLEDDVVVGVFTEVKNTVLGQGTRLRHLSYIGDAEIGKHVNIGAGTIFANFDGKQIQPHRDRRQRLHRQRRDPGGPAARCRPGAGRPRLGGLWEYERGQPPRRWSIKASQKHGYSLIGPAKAWTA